jgi:hypothetical protein
MISKFSISIPSGTRETEVPPLWSPPAGQISGRRRAFCGKQQQSSWSASFLEPGEARGTRAPQVLTWAEDQEPQHHGRPRRQRGSHWSFGTAESRSLGQLGWRRPAGAGREERRARARGCARPSPAGCGWREQPAPWARPGSRRRLLRCANIPQASRAPAAL